MPSIICEKCGLAVEVGDGETNTYDLEDWANGCEHPIVTRSYVFAAKTRQASAGRGADVIFDGLGQDAAQDNLAALGY